MLLFSHPASVAALVLTTSAMLLACSPVAREEAIAATNEAEPATATPAGMDGNWAVLEIDGRPAEPDAFLLRLQAGEVTGGRDGCNNWGYVQGARPLPDGSRMIESDAQACPETPQSRAYRSVIFKPEITSAGPDRLMLTGRGHRLLAARCHWGPVREERPGYSSVTQRCRTAGPN